MELEADSVVGGMSDCGDDMAICSFWCNVLTRTGQIDGLMDYSTAPTRNVYPLLRRVVQADMRHASDKAAKDKELQP